MSSHTQSMFSSSRIPVGISSCLLGEAVRYDGAHKRSAFCNDVLGNYLAFQPFCPEMAIGLGAPRPIIRLVGEPGGLRALQKTIPLRDITDELAGYADKVVAEHTDLCGYIFTEKSPSCGVFRVKHYNADGVQTGDHARGIFAARLIERWPLLPVEEAGRLNDADLCESFVLRVYVWHAWHNQVLPKLSARELIAFWSSCKYLVLAHDEKTYRDIGPLLADLSHDDLHTTAETFFRKLMLALQKPSTRGSNLNALQHLRGYLKNALDETEKQSLTTLLDQYRDGYIPLIVPLAMLRHLLARHPQPYANSQRYLHPYPDELGLRNKK
jgi:uncharacterized protein YbgA (DUF1722 family)/uncharacterized protein YbbK (DUF523 family)